MPRPFTGECEIRSVDRGKLGVQYVLYDPQSKRILRDIRQPLKTRDIQPVPEEGEKE